MKKLRETFNPCQSRIKDVTQIKCAPPSHYVSPAIGRSWGHVARARVMNGRTEANSEEKINFEKSVLQNMKVGSKWEDENKILDTLPNFDT